MSETLEKPKSGTCYQKAPVLFSDKLNGTERGGNTVFSLLRIVFLIMAVYPTFRVLLKSLWMTGKKSGVARLLLTTLPARKKRVKYMTTSVRLNGEYTLTEIRKIYCDMLGIDSPLTGPSFSVDIPEDIIRIERYIGEAWLRKIVEYVNDKMTSIAFKKEEK